MRPSQLTGGAWWRSRSAHENPNMEADAAEKYRNSSHLTIVRGGLYARRSNKAVALQQWLDREFHGVFVRLPIVSDGISDTRRRRQFSWRVHARRVAEVVFADPDNTVIDELPTLWLRYIAACREAARARHPLRRPSGDFPRAA